MNHPANLVAVYEFAADLFSEPVDALAERVEQNFQRLFGKLNPRKPKRPRLPTSRASPRLREYQPTV